MRQARRVLRAGGVVAYPTEAVYGLGCDPRASAAVERIFALKHRPSGKGLILVAADLDQLAPYLQPLDTSTRERVLATWPGPVTWLLPAAPSTPRWLRGSHDTVAVRVSAHPVVRALCQCFGAALVSTSANLSGRPPARTPLVVRKTFGADLDLLIHGALSGHRRPTEIRDGRTGRVVRPG